MVPWFFRYNSKRFYYKHTLLLWKYSRSIIPRIPARKCQISLYSKICWRSRLQAKKMAIIVRFFFFVNFLENPNVSQLFALLKTPLEFHVSINTYFFKSRFQSLHGHWFRNCSISFLFTIALIYLNTVI